MHTNLRMAYCKLSQLQTNSAPDYSQTVCQTVAEVASGKGHAQKLRSRDSVHDLSVKLSPCMSSHCSHSSFPD